MFDDPRSEASASADVEKFFGKYPGLVLVNTVPEEDPEYGGHRGELQVEVSGILEENPEGEGRRPIRVWAKPCFHPGMFFIPEVGQQVWVEFVAGDINTPVWTGVWYPKDAVPMTADEEGLTEAQKVIRTAAGHVVVIDDTADGEQIVIHHKQASFVRIDKDGHITIAHKDGMKIEIAADSAIAITSDTVTITADVTVDGNLSVTGDVTVGQGPSTTISGNEITGG
jgi:hypothetical protein